MKEDRAWGISVIFSLNNFNVKSSTAIHVSCLYIRPDNRTISRIDRDKIHLNNILSFIVYLSLGWSIHKV